MKEAEDNKDLKVYSSLKELFEDLNE